MSTANAIVAAILDAALSPVRELSPLVGLIALAAVAAVVTLLVFRRASDQTRLAAVKRSMQACVLEVRLFSHDVPAMFRALGEILRHNVTYLRLSLLPLLWLVVPMAVLLVHLDAFYGVGELAPGRAVVVKVKVADTAGPTPRLAAPDGVAIESPAVWIPSLREAAWRISVETRGDFELIVTVGDASVTKTISSATGVIRRSSVRGGSGALEQFIHPDERPLPRDSGVESIAVTYPLRTIDVFGWHVHWLAVFFVLLMAFAFALRSPLGVVL